MNRLWSRVLAGAIAFMALVLVIEWWPDSMPVAPPVEPARLATGAHNGGRVAVHETGTWVSAILARPLFSISRKPPKVAATKASGTQEGMPRLSGIMISAGLKRAIFAPDGGGKPLVLAEGASLADTSIRSIAPGAVTLASGEVLRPTYDKARATTTTTLFTPPQMLQPPGFANPAFPNPAFQNPNFPGPGAPGFVPPGAAPIDPDAAPPPMPGFRGFQPPQRRE